MLFKDGFRNRARCTALTSLLICGLNALLPFPAAALTSVKLLWSPAPGTNIAGYKIYYGTASRNYATTVSVGNATNTTVSGLLDGVTYYFAATTLDTTGLESDYSAETVARLN